jgi:hypothetical protein
MRQSIIAGYMSPGFRMVWGTLGTVEKNRVLLDDRKANGETFPREQVVRLPRRVRVVRCNHSHWPLFVRSH